MGLIITWMSRWKLGSMASKWVISPTYIINGVQYIGLITHLLTIDPNFQRDILVRDPASPEFPIKNQPLDLSEQLLGCPAVT